MDDRKVIFIAHNWSETSINIISYCLALSLSEQYHVVFVNAKGRRATYQKINSNLEIYDWPNKRPTKLKDFIFFVKLARKYKPAVTISHFGAVNVCVAGSKLLGIKSVCFYHTLTIQIILDSKQDFFARLMDSFFNFRKKIIYKSVSLIIAGTRFAKEDIIRTWNINPEKIKVVYYGFPETKYTNNYSRIKIGFVGRIDYSKGVDILIDAVGSLLNKNYKIDLEIVGSGILQPQLQNHVEKNSWQDNIKFLGKFPYDRVHEFIASNYIMVLPSRIDNPSVVILESFCTYTPIIASDGGAIPELINHKKNGMLFKSGDAEDLALQIETLLNDKTLRDTLAYAGRKSFEEHYTTKEHVKQVTNIILNELN